jgi:hypothetical protein
MPGLDLHDLSESVARGRPFVIGNHQVDDLCATTEAIGALSRIVERVPELNKGRSRSASA